MSGIVMSGGGMAGETTISAWDSTHLWPQANLTSLELRLELDW